MLVNTDIHIFLVKANLRTSLTKRKFSNQRFLVPFILKFGYSVCVVLCCVVLCCVVLCVCVCVCVCMCV
jgi:hypothetical protein